MKIVQSLWSKPALKQGGYARYNGRWPHARYFWYSWVISVGYAHKHYGQVELVTDNAGAAWLIDKLKLPITSVKTDLESIDASEKLWAWGKVVTYSLQQEPFFHIDCDVYLTGRLPERFEQAHIVCQLIEHAGTYPGFDQCYDIFLPPIERSIPRLPAFWHFTKERAACNCGVMGGTDISAIQCYTAAVIEFLSHPDNAAGWKHVDPRGAMNCVIEQQMLWCSAREQNVPITPIFEDADFHDLQTLQRKNLETNFNHAALEGKNVPFGEHLGKLVEAEYPEQFRIINDLYPRTYATLGMPTQISDPLLSPEDGGESGSDDVMISKVETIWLREQGQRKKK